MTDYVITLDEEESAQIERQAFHEAMTSKGRPINKLWVVLEEEVDEQAAD